MKTFFFALFIIFFLSQCNTKKDGLIMTVSGPVPATEMGVSLIHEHVMVDFIGADSIADTRWNKAEVVRRVLPFLKQIKELGCQTFVECTPEFIGRDPVILKMLADSTGLNILTNTGLYGASNNKYLPDYAYSESADQLSARWINEWTNGIGSTGIRPGFIKIGVAGDSLSDLHKKLVTAAARTHLKTGLVIASHTGPAVPAFEEIDILQTEGVSPDAFIWVHAQAEKDITFHIKAARMGAWIGLDGVADDKINDYVIMIKNLKDNNLLNKVLLSHDAGWYSPGEPDGGDFRGYSAIFEKLVPALKDSGFTEKDIEQLLVINPSSAFKVSIRKLKIGFF